MVKIHMPQPVRQIHLPLDMTVVKVQRVRWTLKHVDMAKIVLSREMMVLAKKTIILLDGYVLDRVFHVTEIQSTLGTI